MVSGYVGSTFWPLAVWIVTLGVLTLGVRKGIERANRIFIPLLGVLFLIMVVRALFLPGAVDGLDALFTPGWSAIGDGDVWIATVFGVLFFASLVLAGLAALVALIVVAWLLRKLPMPQQHTNRTSVVRLGLWWQLPLGLVTPVVLGFMIWDSLRDELTENYADYPTGLLLSAGWGVAIAAIVLVWGGLLASAIHLRRHPETNHPEQDSYRSRG